jgi:hypothetical protein
MDHWRTAGSAVEAPPLVCNLPCSARFALWCLRLATLSAQGHEAARQRLSEVYEILGLPDALQPLEQCVRLLRAAARQGVREFGSLYPSDTELALLRAIGLLQRAQPERARAVLAPCVDQLHLAALIATVGFWSDSLCKAGAVLAEFRAQPDA